MKPLMLTVICTLLFAMGLDADAQVFRLHTGVNMSKMHVSTEQDTRCLNKINIGVTAEFTISHYISFETGIFSSPKGFRIVTTEESDMGTHKEKYLFGPNYMDFFINVRGTYDLDNFRVFGFVGPFFAVGTGGKIKIIDYYDGDKVQTESSDLSWGPGPDDDVRTFDFGFSLGAGVEFRAFQLRMFYQLGLPDVSPSAESWEKLLNRMLGISVGFRFAGS